MGCAVSPTLRLILQWVEIVVIKHKNPSARVESSLFSLIIVALMSSLNNNNNDMSCDETTARRVEAGKGGAEVDETFVSA
jgi:hypothetical protein